MNDGGIPTVGAGEKKRGREGCLGGRCDSLKGGTQIRGPIHLGASAKTSAPILNRPWPCQAMPGCARLNSTTHIPCPWRKSAGGESLTLIGCRSSCETEPEAGIVD
jgi:hypothetical protein